MRAACWVAAVKARRARPAMAAMRWRGRRGACCLGSGSEKHAWRCLAYVEGVAGAGVGADAPAHSRNGYSRDCIQVVSLMVHGRGGAR